MGSDEEAETGNPFPPRFAMRCEALVRNAFRAINSADAKGLQRLNNTSTTGTLPLIGRVR
jgi:hypothetical protein